MVRINSLRNRLVLLIFVITAGAVGFVYLYVVPQLQSSLTAEKLRRLEQQNREQIGPLEAALERGDTQQQVAELVRQIAQQSDARVTLLGVAEVDGEPRPSFVIADSTAEPTAVLGSYEPALAALQIDRAAGGVETISGQRVGESAVPLSSGGEARWVAVLSSPLDEVTDNVALIRRQILIAGMIAVALALLAGFYAARLHARRLDRLRRAAELVAEGDFSSPIPVDSTDELGQLTMSFNEMQHRLSRLDSARKEFIANASHELRTPIFSLGGFVELLEHEDPDPKSRREFVETMREQVERLQKLTTDLLDLSKLDADAMEINLENVDLVELARTITGEFRPGARRKRSKLELRSGDKPVLARCDPDRTAQIIRILLDNALTHTPGGTKVTVTAIRGKNAAQLVVNDEGRGIERRAQERVFERFYTGDSAGGSGLGLAIADELAGRMGGKLEVVSERGYTAFTLQLPAASRQESAKSGAAA
ncbi:MAG: sensor histidine kinase [Solirubrobacterales bacterium]